MQFIGPLNAFDLAHAWLFRMADESNESPLHFVRARLFRFVSLSLKLEIYIMFLVRIDVCNWKPGYSGTKKASVGRS
jgi:hypothetical protein